MKYLICEDFSGQHIPFLFPDRVAHVDMREQLPYAKVVSAGYIELQDGSFVCFGGDGDLNLSARPEDADCISVFFSKKK
ncbi:MAG: hypothetical protein LBN33_10320 [Desulfovibrio sp.]|jgi:hypothetical protein|nr:hypothetical protein [Desulfovibrio sp.]